ncbi:MAG: DUF308 domain-containing protein [Roseovarius sp.]|jgi:uncharacterized membrane protein HdeD (DUF308 family)|nr:DUF308 domain-containing protein [Roseovarius sp.]
MSMSVEAAAQVYREAARAAVKRHWLLYMIEAVILIVAGLAAIIFPVFSSAFFVLMLGWLLIVSGISQAIGLVSARSAPNFWLQLVSVVLAVLVGVLLLRHVGQGMLVISLLLLVYFMIEGVSKIVFALTIRPLKNWFWVLASGVLSVLLSVLLWASMPITALWLIGLLLGVNLISVGAALGYMAMSQRHSETV